MTLGVLVFDDDAAIGRLVVRVASMTGMAAKAVASAEAFHQCLQDDPPQIVVLDLQLGDTDGVQQLRVLADRHYTGSLVLMSGFDIRVLETAGNLAHGLGLKLAGVLEKPLRVNELEAMFTQLKAADMAMSNARLREAMDNDELMLEFQPIVVRKPKTLKKLEALVRWEHPVLGLIPPGEFLPRAESDQATIDALTDWVVSAAAEAYQVLGELGVVVPLSVNISTQNLHDLTLPDRIEQRLRAERMPARHLCLEVTESAAFKDVVQSMDILSRLRLKGIELSIDDFGTGYSSLKLLRQMPFSEIKIDKAFIVDVTRSRDSRAIVKSISDLATNMEMGCVAEGVETEETADLLEQLGVQMLQGYVIARPMPIEAVPSWLAIWQNDGVVPPPAPPVRQTPDETDAAVTAGDHAAAEAPAPDHADKPAASLAAQLSPRQLEVMKALSDGCSVKEIARRLDISVGTVKVHLSLAYSALGARNRVEAVMRAGLHD